MAAGDALGQQFFHGTDQDFEPGDALLSPRDRDAVAESNFGTSDPEKVYLTNSRSWAKGWGRNVYQVQPHDKPVDSGYVGGRRGEVRSFTASSATVLRRVGKKK